MNLLTYSPTPATAGASGAKMCPSSHLGSPETLSRERQYGGNAPSNHKIARPLASRAASPGRGSGAAFAFAALAVLLASTAPRGFAQATAATPEATEDENVVVLSAFTVDAGADSGYRASSTLAGTRLRTELKDVAASISIATREFMQDINAVNAQDLLVYTLGTEISGQGGNFSGAGLDSAWANLDPLAGHPSDLPLRVRGLAGADKTRNYFLTDIDFDNYNVDRVEVNRGPNSILYGLGQPGGIVNATTISPRWDGRKTSIELQYGRFGSSRAAFDHNEVIIPGKLAIRAAAKYSDDRFLQEEAYIHDRRGFVTGTYRPTSTTTIRANYEIGRQTSRKPQLRPPFDGFTWWWDVGRPIYDPTTGVLTLTSDVRTVSPLASGARTAGSFGTDIVGDIISPGGIGNWGQGVGIVYSDPNSSSPGIPGYDVLGTENANLRARPDGSGGLDPVIMRSLGLPVNYLRYLHSGEVGATFWQNQMMRDENIFDYRHHMIESVNKGESLEFDAYNVAIEQSLFDGKGGLELAYDKQNYESYAYTPYSWLTYLFMPDINVKLPNGDSNPNFGRPMLADVGWGSSKEFDREATRATGFYNFDLREVGGGSNWLGRVLGQSTFTGSLSRQEFFGEGFGGRPMMTGLDYYAAESENETYNVVAQNDRRTLVHVSYAGPDASNLASASDARVQQLSARQNPIGYSSIPILYYQSPPADGTAPSAWTTRDISVFGQTDTNKKLTANWEGQRSASKVDSSVFVWQGRMLDEHIIPTFGWRRDKFKTYSAGGAQFDPVSGLMITDPERYTWTAPSLNDSVTSTSWGVVGHAPRNWLERVPYLSEASVFYNKSDNMTVGVQRVDIYGEDIPPVAGSTEEYGISASLFQGKLAMRLNRYETSIIGLNAGAVNSAILNSVRMPGWIEDANSLGLNDDKPQAVAAWSAWAASPAGQEQNARFATFSSRGTDLGSTTDVVSKGYELELTYNPTPGWRISLNASKKDAVNSDSVSELLRYTNELQDIWSGPAADLEFVDNNNQARVVGSYTTADIVAPIRLAASQDGVATQELRKWHFNAVTNYSFNDGALKGFNIGGAMRWMDKVAIGYPSVVDEVTRSAVYDVRNPYFGSSEAYYDAWIGYRHPSDGVTWSVQLNVRNLFADDDLIPVATQPDGSVAAWRLPQPTLWTLTTRFEF